MLSFSDKKASLHMTTHTQQCIASQERITAAIAAYVAQWPDHCTECRGWGGSTVSYDPSPAGVSLGSGSFTDFEPCEACYCAGKCPRCGGLMALGQDFLEEETPCAWCGFTEGTEGAPDHDDCSCWIGEDVYAIAREELYGF